jgi:K+-transporting ATPase KdpF subunit
MIVASLTVDNIIGLVIAVFLVAYLVAALIAPERF